MVKHSCGFVVSELTHSQRDAGVNVLQDEHDPHRLSQTCFILNCRFKVSTKPDGTSGLCFSYFMSSCSFISNHFLATETFPPFRETCSDGKWNKMLLTFKMHERETPPNHISTGHNMIHCHHETHQHMVWIEEHWLTVMWYDRVNQELLYIICIFTSHSSALWSQMNKFSQYKKYKWNHDQYTTKYTKQNNNSLC